LIYFIVIFVCRALEAFNDEDQ
jgi:hypothetical protein